MSSNNIHPDVERVLYTSEEVQKKICELAEQINNDYKDCKELVIVGILKGAVIFCSDLIRKLNIPINLEFMAISSYGDSTQSSVII